MLSARPRKAPAPARKKAADDEAEETVEPPKSDEPKIVSLDQFRKK